MGSRNCCNTHTGEPHSRGCIWREPPTRAPSSIGPFDAGRAEERRAIVAWLRKSAKDNPLMLRAVVLDESAVAIERGAHLAAGKERKR